MKAGRRRSFGEPLPFALLGKAGRCKKKKNPAYQVRVYFKEVGLDGMTGKKRSPMKSATDEGGRAFQ